MVFPPGTHRRPPLVDSALRHLLHSRIANHMLDREALYRQLPGPVQNLICSLEGHRIQTTRFGAPFFHLLEEAEARSHSTSAEVEHFRDRRLHEYVQYCAINVPYYRRWFTANDIDPMEIQTLQDLRALPVVNKKDVQTRVSDFVSTAVPPPRPVWVHTSGTTGAGLRFPTTTRAVREQWATWWRYRRWHGLSTGHMVRLPRRSHRSTAYSRPTTFLAIQCPREAIAPQRLPYESLQHAIVCR